MIVATLQPDADKKGRPVPPAAAAHPVAAPAGATRASDAPAHAVLIVEDSRIVRQRLVGLVAEVPQVRIIGVAEDGFQARDLFQQHRPDAVILDISLPGISGVDLLVAFKREHPACVVIVLTTYAFKEFRQRCALLGADYFFDKATEFERVTGVLATLPARPNSDSQP